ncbi:spinster family MFS transporter [Novosphingopyxis sp.]|uniref:spinster family MFS transporter n=1 Tax=Novosphingopyxis sp. TaxID=2709690 RepID=UPI003B5C70B9
MALGASDKALTGHRERRIVLALMTAAYTFNFVDRTIVAAIGQAIKDDLKITDTQLGLLGGLYFALLYTILGLPLARLAERMPRVNIISAAIFIWSGFTALCGVATSYAALAACRFGVGVGEAGLSPPAHSLLSDYYEPKKRASALSVYSLGVPIGVMIGAVAGGWIAQNYSWRIAFIALGLPGALLAVAIKLLVREPVRGAMEAKTPTPLKPYSLSEDVRETGRVTRAMFGNFTLFNMMIGITLVSFAGYGGGTFVQPYWSRAFGLDYAQIGLITGLIGGASQGAGVLLGGLVSDRLARHGATIWYGLIPAIGIACAYPLILGIYTADSWQAAATWMLFPGALSYTYMGPTYGVIQNAFPTERRATATAVLFFVLNLVALGFGPPLTGWLIDHLGAFHRLYPDVDSLLPALAGLGSVDAAAFQTSCPGGIGDVPGSTADLACRAAVELATRQGVLLAYGVSLWAALHYLLAAISLRRGMPTAQ